MSKELKESVLAKCDSEWQNETNDPKASGFRIHLNSGKYWDIHNFRRTVHCKVSDSTPYDDDVWPIAAQILGIQETKPEPRPSDDLLRMAFEAGIDVGQKFTTPYTGHGKQFFEWLAKVTG